MSDKVFTDACAAVLSCQYNEIHRLNSWIAEALLDPGVLEALAKNGALFARLKTIVEVNGAATDNTIERIQELKNGGDAA